METFWTIIPFIVPLLVLSELYRRYKNKNEPKEKKTVSKLEKYKFYRYLKLIFIERGVVKFWSAIWYVPLFFSLIGTVTFVGELKDSVFPPLPLEKMQTKEGVIKSIILRKNIDDLLILSLKSGKNEEFVIRNSFAEEVNYLLNKKVKVWYSRGWSSAFSIDNIIYEITLDGKSIRKHQYDFGKVLEVRNSVRSFAMYCLYILLFSIFMIWIQNRKELPAHRLYKKNKEEK